MTIFRVAVSVAAVLWVVVLAIPDSRSMVSLEAFQSGPWFPAESLELDGDAMHAYQLAVFDTFPDAKKIASEYPDNPEVALGNIASTFDDQTPVLDDLNARFPHDTELIAFRLENSSQYLAIGRHDSPGNGNWPYPDLTTAATPEPTRSVRPDTVHYPSIGGIYFGPDNAFGPPSPVPDWRHFLALAQSGSGAEPNNTFFDWTKMMALFALRRDGEALRVLAAASNKTDFDDHLKDQLVAKLNTLERARPLSPEEQFNLCTDTQSGYYSDLRDVSWNVLGRVVEMRMRGQNPAALNTDLELVRLGRVMRTCSYSIRGSYIGGQIERRAITNCYHWPGPVEAPEFPRTILTSMLNQPRFLGGLALIAGHPEAAQAVATEWGALAAWRKIWSSNLGLGTAEQDCHLANLQERWGRLLLRTLPICLILLVVSTRLTRRLATPDEPAASPRWHGVLIGACIVAAMAVCDGGLGWLESRPDSEYIFYDGTAAPGLYALMPSLVLVSIAATFVLLSYRRARRMQEAPKPTTKWIVEFEKALTNARVPWELDYSPWVRRAFGKSGRLWPPAALIGYTGFCLPYVYQSGYTTPFYPWNQGLVLAFWAFLVVRAYRRWMRLPSRDAGYRVAVISVRNLTTGYLLAALLLYAASCLLTIPVYQRFSVEFRSCLQTGETKMARHQFRL